jgi:type II secretory pathway pseudopilin PulG
VTTQCSTLTCTRRGITLIESVLSLSIISVLLLGLSSSVMLGVRALPDETELGATDRAIHAINQQLRTDISNASSVLHQVSGDNTRLTLTMVSTGAAGEPSTIVYDILGSVGWIRRRVDAGIQEYLSYELTDYSVTSTVVDGTMRYIEFRFQFDNSIQQYFQLHIQTPYEPTLS